MSLVTMTMNGSTPPPEKKNPNNLHSASLCFIYAELGVVVVT
jgi:hypothetical protein